MSAADAGSWCWRPSNRRPAKLQIPLSRSRLSKASTRSWLSPVFRRRDQHCQTRLEHIFDREGIVPAVSGRVTGYHRFERAPMKGGDGQGQERR